MHRLQYIDFVLNSVCKPISIYSLVIDANHDNFQYPSLLMNVVCELYSFYIYEGNKLKQI